MTDQPGADPAPAVTPGARLSAILTAADAAVQGLKDLAPYGLVALVIIEASQTGKLSDFAVHVLDMVIGAALIAITPTGRKSGQ